MGKNQTPINIDTTIEAELSSLDFKYDAVPLDIINNGHTVQVNYAAGSTLTLDGNTYDLLQFHFHTPSENHIGAKSFPMEAHLVHKNKDGGLGVIGVMFAAGEENPFLAQIWKHLPAEAHGHNQVADVHVNVMDMLPTNKDYYRFNGSLTTPPCSEGVLWLMMKDAVNVSHEQVVQINKIMGNNNRPLQPVNARPVLR
jgi:carbonic anhydrase